MMMPPPFMFFPPPPPPHLFRGSRGRGVRGGVRGRGYVRGSFRGAPRGSYHRPSNASASSDPFLSDPHLHSEGDQDTLAEGTEYDASASHEETGHDAEGEDNQQYDEEDSEEVWRR